jgi:hypothetical protein
MAQHPPYGETWDCEPTLADRDVIDFCRNGYLVLEGVVPGEINRKVVQYLDEVDDSYEPTPIMGQEWFVEGVLKNPQAAGAVRSLLGRDFALPVIISNHRGPMPSAAQGWHRDGGSIHTHELEYLQVFYYPQDCPITFGPTEVLPGSHFMRLKANMMANFGHIAGAVPIAAPAGTVFLTVYSIWHRRSAATARPTPENRFRNLLKYNYWRTVPPQRDWKADPDFDFSTVDFNPPGAAFEQFQGGIAAARMFCWLSGLEDQYRKRGGQGWPVVPTVRDGVEQVGIPAGLRKDRARSAR